VRESRREIGIWRALGMRAKDVVLLFLARAAAVGVAALWLGWGLATLVLGFAHDRLGREIFRFALGPAEAVGVGAAFLFATLLGGLVPAIVASRITIQRSLENAG
jgi:ABC-type antimicrobial peptide transport system permease subunit